MNTMSLKSIIIAALLISVSGVASAAGEAACRLSRDRAAGVKTSVVNAVAQFDTASGWVDGLSNKFCKFQNAENNLGLIDLQTLSSKKPSIAATYLLSGLDMVELEKVIPEKFEGNPGTLFCQALAGSSITRYTSGGFATKEGQDEVCVFGDGSKISIWVLVYTSDDPDYLSMRKAVRSQPLAINLPYMK
jgi:hypothetical protein